MPRRSRGVGLSAWACLLVLERSGLSAFRFCSNRRHDIFIACWWLEMFVTAVCACLSSLFISFCSCTLTFCRPTIVREDDSPKCPAPSRLRARGLCAYLDWRAGLDAIVSSVQYNCQRYTSPGKLLFTPRLRSSGRGSCLRSRADPGSHSPKRNSGDTFDRELKEKSEEWGVQTPSYKHCIKL